MTEETPSLKGGLTWSTTLDPYRKGEKEDQTASLKKGLTFSTTLHPYDGTKKADRMGHKREDVDKGLFGEGLLGESLAPKKSGELAKKFAVPPFTVLNAREGWWQERKRAWLSLGIQSELGRGDELLTLSGEANEMARYDKEAYRARLDGETTLGAIAPNEKTIMGRTGSYAKGAYVKPDGTPESVATPVATPQPKERRTKPAAAKVVPSRGMPLITMESAPVMRAPATKVTRTAAVTAALLPLPESLWVPPTDFIDLSGVKRIAIDVETCDRELKTMGPGVRRGAYICGLAIGIDGGPRRYYPMRHEGGGNCDMDIMGWARDNLNRFSGEVVGAKLDYDLDFLAEEGVTFDHVTAFHDIQIAEPLLDEWRLKYSLDTLSMEYLGVGKNEDMLRRAAEAQGLDPKVDLHRLHSKYVGAYGEDDVDRPLRILPLQLARLEAEGLMEVYGIERRLIRVLLAMRRRGVKVNVAKAEETKAQLEMQLAELHTKLRFLAGPKAEWMAPESFAPALIERGINPPRTPKTGKPSINSYFLSSHAEDELCATIIAGRKVNTIINTFMKGHILGHQLNGRIHTQFIQLKRDSYDDDQEGTIGRIASADPNLQNIPKRNKQWAKVIRSVFEPEDGEDWDRLDESQVEYRFLTNFARGVGAEEARDKYRNDPDTDFHDYCADLAGIADKSQREWIKGLNFGKTYGAQAPKIAAMLRCSLEEAKAFIQRYETALPFTVTTFNEAKKWADKRGYVVTILNRRCRFPFWGPSKWGDKRPALPYDAAIATYGEGNISRADTYTALNKKLQLSSADLIKKAMVDAWEAGLQNVLGAPLLTVHDEMDFSKPRTAAGEEAMKAYQHIMETCIKLNVPLICDRETGPSWGEAK